MARLHGEPALAGVDRKRISAVFHALRNLIRLMDLAAWLVSRQATSVGCSRRCRSAVQGAPTSHSRRYGEEAQRSNALREQASSRHLWLDATLGANRSDTRGIARICNDVMGPKTRSCVPHGVELCAGASRHRVRPWRLSLVTGA